ncbi:MAG: hypothetical protein ACOX17_10470 [Christensenellales bacterium]|jgi:ribosomal protein S27E
MSFRERFSRFMAGRYGGDDFSRFLSLAPLVFILPAVCLTAVADGIPSMLLWATGLALLVWGTLRMFSRNIEARRRENARFLSIRGKGMRSYRRMVDKLKNLGKYRYLKCPRCRAELRVPRHKGKIRITCAKCGDKFLRRT